MDAGNLLLFAVPSTWLKPLPWVALAAVGAGALLYLLGLLARQLAPKVAAIAWTTSKEAMSQPLFFILMAFGAVGLIIFPFIPYNTLGEDLKMLKDEGLSLIMVLSIFLAVWTASLSIAEEIEGRTALTLLSKPIGRRQFIFGKFLGILVPVAIMFIILGAIYMSSISYKIVYDVRETGRPAATADECLWEIIHIAPGLALAFMQAVVLTAISVAISTRLPMMANLIICASIYVLGNLVPTLAGSAMGQIEIVRFVANFLAAVLPVLEHFNISAAISRNQPVPLVYLGWTALYCFLYCCVAMLVALLLFEDRDLA
ncbi:MAG: ABC transporter permease subunit [Pirellulaceae bacterium]|nr:ABC transporter permease subunit [Pirellulaceae bacterium]